MDGKQSAKSIKACVIDGLRLRQVAYGRLAPIPDGTEDYQYAHAHRVSEQVPVDGIGTVERATRHGFALRDAPSAVGRRSTCEWISWPPASQIVSEPGGFALTTTDPRVDEGRPVTIFRFAWVPPEMP